MMRDLLGDFVFPEEPPAWCVDVVDLRSFLKDTKGILSLADMRMLVEQALMLLEMFFVHMPLKRAMHAIDPVQQLRLIKYRLEQMSEEQKMSEISFHKEMTRIFTSLRDLHTNYILPSPYGTKEAILPFQIEDFFTEDNQRKYIVSKLAAGIDHPTFKPGVEVLYWNGVPIEREVELNADRNAGSNKEARYARGLNSLTIRSIWRSLPPDEEWVVIRYRSLSGEELELNQKWLIVSFDKVGVAFPDSSIEGAAALGIDIETYMIHQTKKVLFAPDVARDEKRIARGEILRAGPLERFATSIPGVLEAREVKTSYGTYAYIRIYSFMPPRGVPLDGFIERFISEFIHLAESLPQNGLIIDVRDNGGGLIWASEGLLQLLTPRHIKPEPAQFINTPLTYELCRRKRSLSPWLESIKQAVETGATFSQGFPLTPEEFCNKIGQKYNSPVILITDALCYSATDIFAAGFQDHKIGPMLGTSWNTGAGGANVYSHSDLKGWMGDTESPFKSLPNQAGMRVSLRRLLRVHDREGMVLEDLGVRPDDVHKMTKDDVLNDNIDLINHAASILANHKISLDVSSNTDGLTVKAETRNISRLDVSINGIPLKSIEVTNNSTQFVLEQPKDEIPFIEIRGYRNNTFVAVQRAKI
jgi:Peptidase family S41